MARRTRTLIAAAATGLALAGAVVSTAASAVTGDGTTATITLTAAGSLTISEPTGTTTTPKSLGSTASQVGAWTSGALGAVTVTDTRSGLLNNNWVATAAVSDFDYVGTPPTGATTAQTKILASTMLYNVGTPTVTGGLAFTAAGGAIAANTVSVGSLVGLGTNSVSWSPTLTVTLANQLAGTYRGTIVHSAT